MVAVHRFAADCARCSATAGGCGTRCPSAAQTVLADPSLREGQPAAACAPRRPRSRPTRLRLIPDPPRWWRGTVRRRWHGDGVAFATVVWVVPADAAVGQPPTAAEAGH